MSSLLQFIPTTIVFVEEASISYSSSTGVLDKLQGAYCLISLSSYKSRFAFKLLFCDLRNSD